MTDDIPPMAAPQTGWRALVARQPWAAMFIGIVVLLPFTGMGMLVMLVQGLMRRDPAGLLMVGLLAAVTVAGGAMGGLAWNVVAPIRRRGILAHDLSWAGVVWAYLLGVFAVMAVAARVPAMTRADPEIAKMGAMLTSVAGVVVFVILGLTFGAVLGRSVRGAAAGAPAPAAQPDPSAERRSRALGIGAVAVAIGAILGASYLDADTRAGRHLERGYEHQRAERFEEALAEYTEAARLQPDDATGHHGRGWALFKLGRFDDAIEAYAIAVRLRPDIASIHTEMAAALASAGRYPEAEQHGRDATRLDPRDAWAQRMLADLRVRTQDREGAVAAARDAVRLDPQDPAAHNILARALLAEGRYDEAEHAYREILERRPDWAFGWVQVARLAHQRRDFALADSAFTRAQQLAPEQMARSEEDQELWRNVRKALATGG